MQCHHPISLSYSVNNRKTGRFNFPTFWKLNQREVKIGKSGLPTPSRTGVRFFHLGIRQNLGTVKGSTVERVKYFLLETHGKTYDHRQANLRARGLFAKDHFSGRNLPLEAEAVGWCGDRHFMISFLWSWFRSNDASTLIQHELG